MLSCFHIILERNGQTDRQTDIRRTDRISIACQYADVLTRDKKMLSLSAKVEEVKLLRTLKG